MRKVFGLTFLGILFRVYTINALTTSSPITSQTPITTTTRKSFVHHPMNASSCPTSWKQYARTCYKIYTNGLEDIESKNYDDAMEFCNNIQTNLAVIHSQQEQDFLTTYLGNAKVKNRAYIGLEKHATSGDAYEFKWVEDEESNFTNFAAGEPNGALYERCVHMCGNEAIAGRWNDVPCGEKMGFVCQFHLVETSKLTDGMEENSQCPKGFKFYLDICYRVEEDQENWFNAEERCRAQYGGHLVSILDEYEQAFVNLLTLNIENELWIGFSDTNKATEGMLRWSDLRPVYHTKWDTKEPTEAKSEHRCIAMQKNKKWKVRNCEDKHGFVCAKHKKTHSDKPAPIVGVCPPHFIDVGTRQCYYIVTEQKENFVNAKLECEDMVENGTLAEFRSEHDLILLRPHLARYTDQRFFVGIQEQQYGHYAYVTEPDEDATYLPWDTNEPNNNENEKCVELVVHKMAYNNFNCDHDNFFICQIDKEIHYKIPSHPEEKGGLSGGSVSAIVIVILLLIVGLALVGFFFYRKKSMDDKMKTGIVKFHNESNGQNSNI